MNRSRDRILTTHAGRLERPEAITNAMEQHAGGRPADAGFAEQLERAVSDIVSAQVKAGLDVVNDGEFGKLSWNTYLNGRLAGHELVPTSRLPAPVRTSRDRREFSEFYRQLESHGGPHYRKPGQGAAAGPRPGCPRARGGRGDGA